MKPFWLTWGSVDPGNGKVRRRHINENLVQKAVREAAARTAINKKVSCHTLRHYGVYPAKGGTTHLLEARYDIREVPSLYLIVLSNGVPPKSRLPEVCLLY